MSKETSKKKETELSFSFDSVDEIHDSIQENSPEPNIPAIDAQQQSNLEIAREQAENVDKDGVIFNSEIHATDKDGNPSVTPTGKFRKKRGASKVATQSAAEKTIQDEQAARAAGQLCADMMIGSAVTLLGPEWVPVGAKGDQKPIEFDEHANLRRAFGDYFAAKGISDFPPGIMLTVALSSYAAPRLAAGKETQSRLSKAKFWLAEKFDALKRKRKNASQSDRGDNGKRKDDTRETTVQPKQTQGPRNPST